MNFLDPRPGTPFAGLEVTPGAERSRDRGVSARAATDRASLRGRARAHARRARHAPGVLGGINATIVGNYLTTLGRSAQDDLELLTELKMPVKELSKTL